MSLAVAPPKKVWTEAELQALPDDGYIHELVAGELVTSPKKNFEHEHIGTRLLTALENFNQAHRLGAVLGSSFGCWMHNQNCRAPDLSFIPKTRLRSMGFTPSTRKFLPGAPDLVVEILSPTTQTNDRQMKAQLYAKYAVPHYWIIDPDKETLQAYALAGTQYNLVSQAQSGDPFTTTAVFPGLSFQISDLWA